MYNLDQLGKKIGAIDNLVDESIKQTGLTYSSYALLYSLAAAANGQATQKQIADEWLLPKQTIFNVCKEYKQKGWLEFLESPLDKREKILQLTALGQAETAALPLHSAALSEKVFAAFGEEKSALLFDLLGEFAQVFGEQLGQVDYANFIQTGNTACGKP
ncbi:MarR family winged helix-turn-helix transcriptional regulator [Testudinibacter sp. P27/CKL/0425]